MKITSIKTWKADLVNTKPYTIAFKTVDEVINAFVEITLEDGTTGIGAGAPSEYVTKESLESTISTLTEKNLQYLIGRDVSEINQLIFETNSKFTKNPAVCAAIDIALHDVFTKYLKVPLVKYLGEKIKSMSTSNTIGIKNVADTLKEAEEYGQRGFTILKVKLGIDLAEDIERIEQLRKKFGKKFIIRIDANQGYDIAKTIEFYNKTKHLDVELIEQPLPAEDVAGLRKLPDDIRKIIAADEALLSPKSALNLVQPPLAAGIFNIKLMKCGGISNALKIANIAQQAGVDLFWGCNDESIVSITAALHVAFACENTKYIDLDGSLDLGKDVVKGGFILKDGVMSCSDKAGLGVEKV
jgi:L-Ala-D/L-Glu epimerase